jgi:hypothetical protein
VVIYRAKYPLEKSALIFTHTSYLAQIPTGKWSCTLLYVCPIRIWRALCLTFQPVKSVNLGIFELTPVDFVNKAFCSNGQISGKSKTMFVPSSYANSFATFGNLWVISSLSRTGVRSFKGGAVKPANLRLLKKWGICLLLERVETKSSSWFGIGIHEIQQF